MAPKLDIPILINLSNCNTILHDVFVQMHSILTAQTLTTVNHTQFSGIAKNLTKTIFYFWNK